MYINKNVYAPVNKYKHLRCGRVVGEANSTISIKVLKKSLKDFLETCRVKSAHLFKKSSLPLIYCHT